MIAKLRYCFCRLCCVFVGERCVKERGKESQCRRAGVMSRNEGKEEEELFV